MASVKQIEANRRNGAKGKGPRTMQGKARSKMNALRHGFATDGWRHALAEIEQAEGLNVEERYTLLCNKGWEIDQRKWLHLSESEKGTDSESIARHLNRAAALDRYCLGVDAAQRRLLRKALINS